MQNGGEPGPDEVAIEGEETRENIERPTGPDADLKEVAPAGAEMPGSNEEGTAETETKADSDALQITDNDDEAAPEDPDEAQSPT